MFAFWDAEEFGLIGSTEYAEAMQDELREKAIVYINTDLSMRGRFDGGGTPSLRDFLVQVTRDVPHFDGKGSVYDRWRDEQWARQPVERRRRGQDGFEVELAALGSGADFVAFQDFLGCRRCRWSSTSKAATARTIPTTTRGRMWSVTSIPVSRSARRWRACSA